MMPWLHDVDARSLVLTGENDGGCNPRLNRGIAEALPNAEVVILDHVKHAILLEAPDQVAAELKRFMTGLDR
jgi:pimeloyl-ACP methyl ester carboxylesterase